MILLLVAVLDTMEGHSGELHLFQQCSTMLAPTSMGHLITGGKREIKFLLSCFNFSKQLPSFH